MDVVAHARELHRQAIVIDGHCDVLERIADGKMRLGARVKVPDPATWAPPPGFRIHGGTGTVGFSPHTYYFGTMGQYDLPRLAEGGVTVQTCSLYMDDTHLERSLQRGLEMVWWLKLEAADNPNFSLITSVADIHRVKREGGIGAILSFEGFEPLGTDLRFLDLYDELGLRMAGLTHARRNLFADGLQHDVQSGGLTALGKQAVQRMNQLGIVIDLAHLSQAGFREVMELTSAPVVMSHTSPSRFFADSQPDTARTSGIDVSRERERLHAIARNGGVAGVIWYGQADLNAVVADIEFVLEAIGPDHVPLGSDLFGADKAPRGLEDISKVPAITLRLVERGHSDEVIRKFLGGNLLRVFGQVWHG